MPKRILPIAVMVLTLTHPILAQWIPIRTVPIIAGKPSDFHPSLSRGMGNLSIAFDDPLVDPFVNPAKGSVITQTTLFASPTRNSWSNEDGRAVTTSRGTASYPGAALNSIPFGGHVQSANFFAGGLIAYQEIRAEREQFPGFVRPTWLRTSESASIRNDLGNNTYVSALFGYRFPGLSFAGSVSWGWYEAMDGVSLLYPGSIDIRQSGRTAEYKLGLLAEVSEQDRLEFIGGRSGFRATHEVTFPVIAWGDPAPSLLYEVEVNKDQSNEWLLHAGYQRKLNQNWTIGSVVTVNWKDHPKIPNYSLANIPRDPGTSVAYNFGFGFVKSNDRSLWGLEYIYEPITSYTWAEAGEGPDPAGPTLPSTFKTVENFFDFANHILRAGVKGSSKNNWLEYRLGAQLHFYSYSLNQINNLEGHSRSLDVDWVETTLTGGLSAKIGNIHLMYTLQLILGNGLVGTVERVSALDSRGGLRSGDYLIAPSGELVVDKINLVTQQLTFIYRME